MDAIDLIVAKRDGGRLSDAQIDWFLRGLHGRRRWATSRRPPC